MAGLFEAKMRTRTQMKMWVPAKTRGMRVSTALVIKNLETKEEEVEDVDTVREEEAFMVHVFTATKKAIKPMSALNTKEGHIGEMMLKKGLLMWMMILSHHIQRMQKEERFWLKKGLAEW